MQWIFFRPSFLVADTQLYKRLCPSVRQSIRPSVHQSARVEKWGNAHIRPCPPVRNWRPCIRPYYFLCIIYHIHFWKPTKYSNTLWIILCSKISWAEVDSSLWSGATRGRWLWLFHWWEHFCPSHPPPNPLKPKPHPRSHINLMTQISVLRPKYQSWGPNLRLWA